MLIGAHLPLKAAPLQDTEVARFRQALCAQSQTPPDLFITRSAIGVGAQASRSPAGQLTLFSGHIENRADLIRELGIADGTDSQIYAAGLAAWGEDVDLRIFGTYATITLYPNTPQIRLATSPIHCAPLHYRYDAQQFIVASRVQAIFDTGRVARTLNEQKVADSLFLNYLHLEESWFEGMAFLPSGTRAYVSPEGFFKTRYYNLLDLPDIRLNKDQDYVEAAEELFTTGTRQILEGFKRPAISVSGGYDSQAVAAYVMHTRPELDVYGYTSVPEKEWDGITTENRFGDERPYVEAFAKLYPQFKPHFIDAAGLSFDHFQRDVFSISQHAPRNAMNLHWIHEIRRQAKADGCDVILTGAMGNATFSYAGEMALPSWLAKGQLHTLTKELIAAGPIYNLPKRFLGRAVAPLLPHSIWKRLMEWRSGGTPDPFDSWCPMNREYAQQMDVFSRAEAVGFDPLFKPPATSKEYRAKLLAMAGGSAADTKQALSLIHGLPTRDPTSYRPLVEFCFGIPDSQYLRNGVRRWLAKRMLKGKVPDMVLHETSRGRQAADWHLRLLRQREDLISEIDWLSEDPRMAERLNLPALKQALIDFPQTTPTDQKSAARLQLAVTRGLTTARFIRYLEGRNS